MFYKITFMCSVLTKRWSVKLTRLKYSLAFLPILSLTNSFAQEKPMPEVAWNGYTQLRLTSNINDVNSFAMRRMKLWVNSAPGFNEHWGFHLQTTISSNQNEKFLLQDVEVSYQTKRFKISLGQFVPQYSLERFQPDFEIPLTERADVINALIPDGTLGVRDIGTEVSYAGPDQKLQMWLGVFNGYGIKEYRLNNSGILLTQKSGVRLFKNHLFAGYSVMYRKADHLQLKSLLPDSIQFSGNDIRYNMFAQFQSGKFEIQAEYLFADLENKTADGYYVLATITLSKNQIVASWNQYNDLIENTGDSPVIHLGYNYLINKDNLKILFDNGVQLNRKSLQEYFASIQFQLFFN